MCKDGPKLFYRRIRGKMTNRGVVEQLEKDGIIYRTAQEMSEIMNKVLRQHSMWKKYLLSLEVR